MIALLIGGTAAFCAGILAVVYGIPIKEFSLGNTLLLIGTILSSTGLLLIGLALVVRELRRLVGNGGLGKLVAAATETDVVTIAAVPTPARGTSESAKGAGRTAARAPGNNEFLFSRDDPHDASPLAETIDPFPSFEKAAEPMPPEEPERALEPAPEFARKPRPPLPPRPERPEPAERPRRDFLFSSRRRENQDHPDAPPLPPREPSHDLPGRSFSGRRPPEPNHDRGHDLDSMAREPLNAESPPMQGSFEPSWTADQPHEQPRPEPDFAPEPGPRRRPPPAAPRFQPPREEPAVTVVKSGVVDTMAYSLYSDGSIEAQLPEGTVRFESIDELRAHLDQRG